MRTLMDRINKFESLPVQTVAEFNKEFTECPLLDVAENLEVGILELADSDTTRFVQAGNLTIKHRFVPVKDLVELTEEVGQGLSTADSITPVRENKRSKWSR